MVGCLASEGFMLATGPDTTPAQAENWLARWAAATRTGIPRVTEREDLMTWEAARWREEQGTCPWCGGDPETHEAVDF